MFTFGFVGIYCTVSAQTNNAPTNTNTVAFLTTNDASYFAQKIALDQYLKSSKTHTEAKISLSAAAKTPIATYLSHHGLDTYMRAVNDGPQMETHFTDGHWISHLEIMPNEYTMYIAKVEIAPDGSTNKVEGVAVISTDGINAKLDQISAFVSQHFTLP